MTKEEDLRFDALVGSLSARLRPVCTHWPEELFTEMVRHLAEITLKYEGESTPGPYDRRTTDRLVADMKELLERSQHIRTPETSLPKTESS